ncbi:hypothetical protein BRADI_1g02755v3 [Brachypodium distachyon]|uniref:Uncharacterized protein n=1 Tax=Brachypodium distachyon TaxID=15368 RepID=A0A2K2DHU2_BRADI|nr:hypothetical protein BRADI_1g02755v3 [Brachypodium distachyon]
MALQKGCSWLSCSCHVHACTSKIPSGIILCIYTCSGMKLPWLSEP